MNRVDYQRYKRKSPRPLGMGPFFDFGLAMAAHFAARAARASARREKSLVLALVQQRGDDERWDAEGGNNQTRIARRGAGYAR